MTTAIACAAALAAGACGKSEDQQASETVEEYVGAREGGDQEKICDLLGSTFKQQLGLDANCSNLPAELSGRGRAVTLEIVDVRVHEGQATGDLDVTTESGQSRVTLRLMQEDDEWKISGLQ